MSRYQSIPVWRNTHQALKELSALTGKPVVRQIDDLVNEKLIEERRRQTARQEGAAA
ncbi:MAG: hypothetical protein KC518_13280 [Candidatus Cloacimonetes bacterium]|nr:hypothetical protein [Candidatus Cloacimonadota bacterium]